MKNFLKKSILPVFIGFLFLSTIVAFFLMIVVYHKPILRSVGIYINDDCHFSSLSKIKCSYIDISDRKSFFFDIRDLSLKIRYKNIFSGEKAFFLNVDFVNGRVIPKKEQKKKKQKVSLSPLFYGLGISSLKVNTFNLVVEKENPVVIKDASLSTENNKIRILKPFSVLIGKEKIFIEKIEGNYTKSFLNIKEFLIKAFNGKIDGKLAVNKDADLFLDGNLTLSEYTKNVSVKNINAKFLINGNINESLKGKATYTIKKIFNKNFSLSDITGKLSLDIKEYIKGKNNLFLKEFSAKNVKISDSNLKTDFSLKNDFFSKNVLTVKTIDIAGKKLNYVSSIFNAEKKGNFLLKGKAFYKDITGNYILSIGKKAFLKVSLPEYSANKILYAFGIKNKILENLSLKLSADYFLDLKSLKGSGLVKLSDIDIFGISFSKGKVDFKQDIKKNVISLNAFVEKKNSFIKGKGFVKGKNLNIDLSYKNVDISNLIFTKNIGLAGIFSGKGKVSGSIPEVKVSLEGNAPVFRYKNLSLTNFSYAFLYKEKHITVYAKNPLENLSVKTDINLSPFYFSLNADAKKADLKPFYPFLNSMLPDLFSQIRPENATGKFSVYVDKNDFKLDMNIKKSKIFVIPAQDYIYASLKGKISKKEKDLSVSFFKKKFSYQKNIVFDSLKGLFTLKNNAGNVSLEVKGLNKVDFFHSFSALNFNIKTKTIDGDIFTTVRFKDYKTTLNANLTGTFDRFSGVMFTEVYLKDKKFTENFLNYNLKKDNKGFVLDFHTTNLDFFINSSLEFIAKNPKGKVFIRKEINGFLTFDTLIAYQNRLTLFKTSPVKVSFNKESISTKNIDFEGLITGKIYKFSFDIPKSYLYLKSDGKIDKLLLSELIMFGTVDGFLKYSFIFDGSVANPQKNVYLHAFSKNLKLRSSYLRGFITFNNFDVLVKKGKADINIEGKTSSLVSGESKISVKGRVDISTLKNKITLYTHLLPVRYPTIFEGSVNTDVKVYSRKNKVQKQYVEGDISVSGRVRLDPDIQKQFSKSSATAGKKQESNLENIVLNLNAKTFSPVYIYGKWGSAYGEGVLTVKGTAKKPVVNGYINIVYGKINYMKNKYNIDYAKIKIIDNQPYISARLSTVVANTFIYININGNLKNPNLSFTSIPPKSKNEILSILLFKDTPGALESIPLFTAIGKIIYAFLPFGTEEDRGLFNTGFNVTIIPSYNPLYGITASLYARKNFTRRFYIAFSRPIREVEGINIFGWYEFGLNITEQTSLQFRWYENQDEEVHIMFSLPFDF